MKYLNPLLLAVVLGFSATAWAGKTQTATFASGCFWCTEADFEKLDGVISAVSGYIGGQEENPSYKDVSKGSTGHTEAVELKFDPDKISYQQLLDHFWRNVDPTVKNQQFCDRGSQYRSGIFYHNAEQEKAARESLIPIRKKFGTVFTEITPASTFYRAEDYHQDYAKKNPIRYRWYRNGCGRDKRLEQLWAEQ